jgi:F0F1-type ATP synthase delta subunit
MKEVFDEFSKRILTKEDLIFYLDEIGVIEKLIFQKTEISLSEKAKEKVSNDFLNFVQELERKNLISKDPERNRAFFEEFKKYLLEIPQVKIEVAFKPKREFLKKIINFFEREFQRKIILDLTINPEIIGGIVFEWKGKIFDFSLAKRIEKIISK